MTLQFSLHKRRRKVLDVCRSWSKGTIIPLMLLCVIGCQSSSSSRVPRPATGVGIPIPSNARNVTCYFSREPRLVVQFDIQVPTGSLQVFNFYNRWLEHQNWKPARNQLTDQHPRFLPLSPGQGRALGYMWVREPGSLMLLLVVKATGQSSRQGSTMIEKQQVNINIAPREHILEE